MSQRDRAQPVEIHRRDDPGVDPPTVALGLDIERRATEGDVLLFLDDEPDPARSFELHRVRGAFRISDGVAQPRGCFASAQVAIHEGWAMVDAISSDPFADLDAPVPPIGTLLGEPDPTGDDA